MAALNPFFDDNTEEEDSAEEETSLPEPVNVTNNVEEPGLPDPVKATENNSDPLQPPGDEDQKNAKDGNSVNESQDDDMLEIGVSQSELEELGGGNNTTDGDKEEEDIEIISEAASITRCSLTGIKWG